MAPPLTSTIQGWVPNPKISQPCEVVTLIHPLEVIFYYVFNPLFGSPPFLYNFFQETKVLF